MLEIAQNCKKSPQNRLKLLEIAFSNEYKILAGPAGIKCLTSDYLNSGRNVLILYEDASLRIFDLKTCECKSTLSIGNRIEEAICMDITNDGKTVLVGSSTGQICVLNIDESNLNLKLIDRIETNDQKEYKVDIFYSEHMVKCGHI